MAQFFGIPQTRGARFLARPSGSVFDEIIFQNLDIETAPSQDSATNRICRDKAVLVAQALPA